MLKMNDIRQMNIEDLKKRFLELKRELFNLRFQKAQGQLEKTHEMRRIRQTIARIKTNLSQHFSSAKKGLN